MPFRIETDAHLREVLGTDGAAWAGAYIKQHQHAEGDARHHELTAWFDQALQHGMRAEQKVIADGLVRICDDYPMRASDIGLFLAANQFPAFLAIWTGESDLTAEQALLQWQARAACDRGDGA